MNTTQPPTQEKDGGLELSDEELIAQINRWQLEASTLYDELKKVWEQNERYYIGNQTEKDRIPSHQSDAVQNHIFMGIETIVPIATANLPQFVAEPAQASEASNMLATSLEKMLQAQYHLKNIQMKQREALRYMLLYRLGILKVFWNEKINDLDAVAVRPQRIWIPPYGLTTDDLPYIIEKIDLMPKEVEEIFGKDKADQITSQTETSEEKKIERLRTIQEVWTDDWVVWKSGNVILDKRPNPYWDWEGEKDGLDELRFFNHFPHPRKPYIIRSLFQLGNTIVGDTDLIQQTIPIQDTINSHVRQTVNNATRMANSVWLIDSSCMSEEEADSITNASGLKIIGQDVANPNKLRRDPPPPLPKYIVDSKVQAENAFDNIFGTHSTTRGERGQAETLGGRILLRQADYGRIGDIVKVIDDMTSELGNWFTQLMKLYYVNPKTLRLFGDTGTQFISLSRDKIEDGIEVLVKSGSTLPTDEISQRNEAVELWQMGAIDPITLFERLKFPNPRETAERLVMWQMGQLIPGQMPAIAQPAQPRQPNTGATATEGQRMGQGLQQRAQGIRGE